MLDTNTDFFVKAGNQNQKFNIKPENLKRIAKIFQDSDEDGEEESGSQSEDTI